MIQTSVSYIFAAFFEAAIIGGVMLGGIIAPMRDAIQINFFHPPPLVKELNCTPDITWQIKSVQESYMDYSTGMSHPYWAAEFVLLNKGASVFDATQTFSYTPSSTDTYNDNEFQSTPYAIKILGEHLPVDTHVKYIAAKCLLENTDRINSAVGFRNSRTADGSITRWVEFDLKR